MLLSAITAPFVGTLVDCRGTRFVLIGCVPISVLSLLWLSSLSTASELVVAISVNRVISADTLPFLAQTALSQWFVKHRGRAGIGLGFATAFLLFFPSIEIWLQSAAGGRHGAYVVVCAGVAIGGCLLAVLWRNTPESMDLLPDFCKEDPEKFDIQDASSLHIQQGKASPNTLSTETISFTRAEAACSTLFWAIVLTQFNNSVLWVGCHFHLLDLLKERTADSTASGAFYTAVSLARVVVSTLLGMFVIDRLGAKSYILLAIQAIPQMLVTLALLGFVGPAKWERWMVFVFGMVYGSWGGIFTAVGNVVFAQLYGRAHLGSIAGLAKGFSLIAGALGPAFLGGARQIFGS